MGLAREIPATNNIRLTKENIVIQKHNSMDTTLSVPSTCTTPNAKMNLVDDQQGIQRAILRRFSDRRVDSISIQSYRVH